MQDSFSNSCRNSNLGGGGGGGDDSMVAATVPNLATADDAKGDFFEKSREDEEEGEGIKGNEGRE